MGAHFSRDAYARLRERVNTLTLKDMRAAAAAPTDWRAVSAVTADTTVEALVDRLASAPGGACVVLDPTGQKVVGSVDLFHVARFVLALYEGSTEHREIAVEHEAFDFWLGWERWIERRIAEVPSPNAEAVLRTGAATFFSVTVAEVLASPGLRAFSRVTYPDEAISDTALVAQALPLWARGFANLLLKTADGEYCFLSAADVLSALWTGVLRTNLQGVGAIRFKKLGVSSHVVYSVEMGQRALQAFRLMSDRGVQAVPIVGEHGWLKGEISLQSLRALRASNFNALLGSVGHLVEECAKLGQASAPLTVRKDATLAQVVELMYNDPDKRTHVWVVSKHTRVTGVVSLTDIARALTLRLQQG